MKNILFLLLLGPIWTTAQPELTKWKFNTTTDFASYWAQTGTAQSPAWTWVNTTDSADVLKICYNTTFVYVRSNGMTDYMGKYLNPGYCSSQNYVHRIVRSPTVPATKTTSPKIGAIGLLINGIPIYGLGNSQSWNGSANVPNGLGIWNVEVYKSEGFTLDTAFAAHPQQQQAYHSHASPFRLYKYTPTTTHSPLIGYAFDGYPVYGPYGYSTPTDANSAVTRMKTGYSLRNITVRHDLPYGVSLPSNQWGPNVSATYPIGTYCEDYEWLASNGGDLDIYNGRFCVTPEYPAGTYCYFTTITAAGVATFPYLIGVQYYGAPDTGNFTVAGGTGNSITLPSSGVTCVYNALPMELITFKGLAETNRNRLVWATATEQGISHFTLERSENGLDFIEIGSETSKGSSVVRQDYSFDDESPLAIGFYRLRSVERDGSSEVSPVISVVRKAIPKLEIFPSKTADFIHVRSTNSSLEGQLEVIDLTGKQMKNAVLTIEKGESFDLDLSDLPDGLFLVSVRAGGISQVLKIIKQG